MGFGALGKFGVLFKSNELFTRNKQPQYQQAPSLLEQTVK